MCSYPEIIPTWQPATVIEMRLPAHHLETNLRVGVDIVGPIGVRIGRRSRNLIEGSPSQGFMIIPVTGEARHLFKLASRGFDKTPIHAGSQISYLEDLVGFVLTHDSSPFLALASYRVPLRR